MNKTEAAAMLGVSVRAIERYAAAEKLPARYVRGKTGQVLDFDPGEIERFKSELETPISKGAPTAATRPDESRQNPQQHPTEEDRQVPTMALAKLGGPSNGRQGLHPDMGALLEALRKASTASRQPLSVPVEAKPLLTVGECCALTGLSQATIKRAIDEKRLAARVMGRARRVRRDELDEWLKTV